MTFVQRLARAQMVLGAGAVAVGVVGFVSARHVAFNASIAPRLGPADLSLQAMSLNRLAALVVIGLGAVGVLAGATQRPIWGAVPAAGFALLALQVLIQWRPAGTNWFASIGSNFSFSLLGCVGFAVTACLERNAATQDRLSQADP